MRESMQCIDELEAQFARHPSLPREAVLKADLLRTGIRFDQGALVRAAAPGEAGSAPGQLPAHHPKSYFIFSFDMVRHTPPHETQTAHPPEHPPLPPDPTA